MFVPGKPLQPSLMFVGKAKSMLDSWAVKGILFLFTNIRLGCKDLPGTSTLLYYENFKITGTSTLLYYEHFKIIEVKVFIILNPGACTVKLFTIVIIYI